ncbi:hypothetical protein DRB05_02945 [Pseudoalteromonas sp. A757]|nr:hypothetical protein DRB05_02945 [Pseudoalteromonas sp. A757]
MILLKRVTYLYGKGNGAKGQPIFSVKAEKDQKIIGLIIGNVNKFRRIKIKKPPRETQGGSK